MTLDRIKLSAQTVRDNIAILEEVQEPDDAGYYLQLEHEKFVLECIERQIPKKPIGEFDGVPHFRCPACFGGVVLYEKDKRFPCCQYCGQKIDWSDTV